MRWNKPKSVFKSVIFLLNSHFFITKSKAKRAERIYAAKYIKFLTIQSFVSRASSFATLSKNFQKFLNPL